MQLRALAHVIDLADGDPLPTEFCLFKVGVNDSTKGSWVWDAQAAELVMSQYKRRGVDVMIDLNHDSRDPAARRARKDAADAMGYCNLELRNGGELWMTNIRFNAEGAERLRSRKQRYFSPTFFYDPETSRAVELVNVALTADPATYDAQPLIAASNSGLVPVNMQTRALARAYSKRK